MHEAVAPHFSPRQFFMDLPIWDISCKQSRTICDLLCLAPFIYVTFLRFIHVKHELVLHFFTRTNNVPLYGLITDSLSTSH